MNKIVTYILIHIGQIIILSIAGMYEGGSRRFRPDIEKPRQIENAARDIAPSLVRLMNQFQVVMCSSMLEALVLVVVLFLLP